ncbi:MAG: phytanoyl-CoA dioxygenase family protein [Gammaproteobacteria bacterium]|nr:phytanoyl-CoA dioxygenase family protein [Gammaproteobacteria bacterium]
MEINDWTSVRHLPELYRELKQIDLLENIAELEAFGFTVVPPEKVGPRHQHEAVRDSLLTVACDRKECDLSELEEVFADGQELMRFMLWDDPIFEKTLLNPAGIGLVQYLLGTNCILSLCDGWLKGEGDARTGVHADWAQFEMVTFPPEPFTANFNYLLSDYSKDDGALAFVPGSHRWRRFPSPEEAEYWLDRAQPVEAPMGSMIIWGDHTWHCSYPRKTNGLRLMMLATFCRPHMQSQEPFRMTVTQEALDRNPVRFGQLMDIGGAFPFGKSPARPRQKKPERKIPPYLSLFDEESADGTLQLRPQVDFDHYDRELNAAVYEGLKGKKIPFPDVYRIKR